MARPSNFHETRRSPTYGPAPRQHGRRPGTAAPGRMRFIDMPLKVLIMRPFDVQSFQVSGRVFRAAVQEKAP
jgi:hypothetical protein